ncbi:MAG: hypothetical protein R3272_15145 [Candidatus Promineifilaceae bacterium]|nr:hypothetical protein [Candidatus Promineifilaceae bacterium]
MSNQEWDLIDEPEGEVQEEIFERDGPRQVARRERVEIVRDDGLGEEHIVEDHTLNRQGFVTRAINLLWLLVALVEFLIILRVALKLIAANPDAPFVALVYSASYLFLWPFLGMTATPAAGAIQLEISSIIAMFVYLMLGWVVAQFIRWVATPTSARTVAVRRRRRL